MARLRLRDAQAFIHNETSGGVFLFAAALAALLMANSPLAHLYDALLETHVAGCSFSEFRSSPASAAP